MNKDCNPCNKSCGPACYDSCFSIDAAPFDPSLWYVTINGKLNKVKIPPLAETDTTLSTNYSTASLIYNAEKHVDEIAGSSLGDLINVEDLRNTNIPDYNFGAMCAEFIYHKYGECGAGCKSLEDAWTTFSLTDEGAKQNSLKYVRGANAYGCPIYLDVPPTLNEYWYAGWRMENGNPPEFGYYQSTTLPKLPENGDGDYLIACETPNRQPAIAPFPFKRMLSNIVGSLGIDISSRFSKIQETPGFVATFNNLTGDFDIEWNDWWPTWNDHVGTGHIIGKIAWTYEFDIATGNMKYGISEIYFQEVNYTTIQGAPGYPGTEGTPNLTLAGIKYPGGTKVPLLTKANYDPNSNWTKSIGLTVECQQEISVPPNGTVGPFDFLYIYNDWYPNDDEGNLGIIFHNKIGAWEGF